MPNCYVATTIHTSQMHKELPRQSLQWLHSYKLQGALREPEQMLSSPWQGSALLQETSGKIGVLDESCGSEGLYWLCLHR